MLVLAAIAILAISCGSNDGHSVALNIENAEGQLVTFNKRDAAGMIILDSARVGRSGEVVFDIPALPLDFYQIVLAGTNKQCAIAIDSTERLSMRIDAEEFDVATNIEGSQHTAKFHEWYSSMKANEKELEELKKGLTETPEDKTLLTRYNDLNKSYYDDTKAFITDNAGSPVVIAALNKINFQTEKELYKSAIAGLAGKMDQSVFFQSLNTQVQRVAQQEAAQEQQRLRQEQLAKLIPVGQEAPDFTQKTPEGKDMSLSDLRGKVVLVDFWASWCKPCRAENPNVVRMYNKYKSKGFDILSVSLDKTQDKWVNAIAQDNMTWHHVSDLKAWQNSAARQYGVQSIPFTVLVDKDGTIIQKNLRGRALENKLDELFGA